MCIYDLLFRIRLISFMSWRLFLIFHMSCCPSMIVLRSALAVFFAMRLALSSLIAGLLCLMIATIAVDQWDVNHPCHMAVAPGSVIFCMCVVINFPKAVSPRMSSHWYSACSFSLFLWIVRSNEFSVQILVRISQQFVLILSWRFSSITLLIRAIMRVRASTIWSWLHSAMMWRCVSRSVMHALHVGLLPDLAFSLSLVASRDPTILTLRTHTLLVIVCACCWSTVHVAKKK